MDKSVEILSKIMDATALRQTVLANNLANVNTPHYKRMDVKFKEALTSALESSDSSKVAFVSPKVVEDKVSLCRPDGNNVTLQHEIGEMNENSLLFQLSAKTMSQRLELIRRAARGR